MRPFPTKVLQAILGVVFLFSACDIAFAKRVALVVGNNAYRHLPRLQKAVGDAKAMKETLTGLGFTVSYAENLDYRAFVDALATFESSIAADDEAVFHYSGHGVAINGRNYLLPIDMQEAGDTEQFRRISSFAGDAGEIVETLLARRPKYVFAILDACRDNPFATATRSLGATRGLARMEAEPGAFILFSAGPGERALDRLNESERIETSVFTRVLLRHVGRPGLTLQAVAKATQREVYELASTIRHRQFPDYSDRTLDDLILAPSDAPATMAAPRLPDSRPDDAQRLIGERRDDEAALAKARSEDTLEAWEAYQRRPRARRPDEARLAIARLSPGRTPSGNGAPPLAALRLRNIDPKADTFRHLTASPDGRLFAAVGSDNIARVWEAASGKLRHHLIEETKRIAAIGFSEDGKTLVTAFSEGSLTRWDVGSGKPVSTFSLGEDKKPVLQVAFSRNGRFLLSIDAAGSMKIREVGNGRIVHRADSGMEKPGIVGLSADGDVAITTDEGPVIRIWKFPDGAATPLPKPRAVSAIAISDDHLMAVAEATGTVTLHDLSSGKDPIVLPGRQNVGVVAFRPDGLVLATTGTDQAILLWDVARRREIQRLEGHNAAVRALAWLPDGKALVSGAWKDGLRMWDIAEGRVATEIHAMSETAWISIGDQGYVASSDAHDFLGVARSGTEQAVDEAFKQRWLKPSLSAER